jgi:hypothetical protein
MVWLTYWIRADGPRSGDHVATPFRVLLMRLVGICIAHFISLSNVSWLVLTLLVSFGELVVVVYVVLQCGILLWT